MSQTKDMLKTEQKAGERSFCSSEMLYHALIRSTDDYVYVCNMKTGVFRYCPAQVEKFPLPGEVIKNPLPYWKEIVHPSDWDRFFRANQEIGLNGEDSHSVEFRAKTRQGEYVWLRCRGYLTRDEKGQPGLFAGIMSPLGKQNKMDPLTQLLNYSEFLKDLRQGIGQPSMEQIGILMLDVDNFRQINELYGRAFGDKVLQTLSQMVLAMLPDNARMYRLENDRVGILLNNASAEDTAELYYFIRNNLQKIQSYEYPRLRIQISAGCTVYPDDSDEVSELYQYADFALQSAKAKGKNRIEIFTEEILRDKRHTLELIRKLRSAIINDYEGFYVEYQPQMDIQTGKLSGVEALMRWRDRCGNQISPGEFITTMEENGMIYDAGLWVLRESLRCAAKWFALQPTFHVSVNVSALQMMEKRFLGDLQQILEETKFPCENLIIELTESCAVQNIELFSKKFEQMRQWGIQIAMDDFGTGYSSLSMLKWAMVDIVKIDQGFVKDILGSKFDATFISFTVEICHSVGIKVCLEGVETKEEFEFLKSRHLDFMQGYYIGEPMGEREILQRLEQDNIK